MFSRKKGGKDTKKSGRSSYSSRSKESNLNEFGIANNPNVDDAELEAELYALTGIYPAGENDIVLNTGECEEDLEAELLRLVGGSKSSSRSKTASVPKKELPINLKEIRNTLEKSISIPDEDDELIDENDEELLNELRELNADDDEFTEEPQPAKTEEKTIFSVLNERLEMYQTAENNAKANKESARARRFNRGIKTLESLIKTAESGNIVRLDEIPPAIATNLKPATAETHIKQGPSITATTDDDLKFDVNELAMMQQNKVLVHEMVATNDGLKSGIKLPVVGTIGQGPLVQDKVVTNDKFSNLEDSSIVVEPSQPIQIKPDPVVDQIRCKPEDSGSNNHGLDFPSIPIKPDHLSKVSTPSPNSINTQDNEIHNLRQRRERYKIVALQAKKQGDMKTALETMKQIKQIDKEIELKTTPTAQSAESLENGLRLRLDKFINLQKMAEKDKDLARCRRYKRIIGQYEEAIVNNRGGQALSLQVLPNPPGFPPIVKS